MKKTITFVFILSLSVLMFAPEVSSFVKNNSFETALKMSAYKQQYRITLDLVKKFEGLRLVKYWDVKQFSIGYGHAIRPGESFNMITEQEAELLLHLDFERAIQTVEENTGMSRYDYPNKVLSLSSFVFNVGEGNFINSTLLTKLKANESIDNEFLRWTNTKSGDVATVNKHLVKRRTLELNLFNS